MVDVARPLDPDQGEPAHALIGGQELMLIAPKEVP